MKVTVEFYELNSKGQDQSVGRLVWDGKTIVADPPENEVLREVLNEPVIVFRKGRGVPVQADRDPEAFMNNLYREYKSAYLRASKPEKEK